MPRYGRNGCARHTGHMALHVSGLASLQNQVRYDANFIVQQMYRKTCFLLAFQLIFTLPSLCEYDISNAKPLLSKAPPSLHPFLPFSLSKRNEFDDNRLALPSPYSYLLLLLLYSLPSSIYLHCLLLPYSPLCLQLLLHYPIDNLYTSLITCLLDQYLFSLHSQLLSLHRSHR
jgi:hypothetical protein